MVRHIRHSVYILTENIKFEKPFSEGNCHFSGEYSVILLNLGVKIVLQRIFCSLLCVLLLFSACAGAMTRDELRFAWQQISSAQSNASPYLDVPDPSAFFAGTDVTRRRTVAAMPTLMSALLMKPFDSHIRRQNLPLRGQRSCSPL